MWDPNQYERFKAERAQPFHDLAALVEPRPSLRVVDLGCGTGELTRTLHERLHARETLGIDSSAEMLAKSAPFADAQLRFERRDIESFVQLAPEPFDLVFSNAALQWLPDHESLFPRLATLVADEGQLAVQMPANDQHPSHVIAGEVASEFGVAPRSYHMLPLERYAELLHESGFARQIVRMQAYGHVLDSTAGVVEWVKGTLLTDYEKRMEPTQYAAFLDRYRRRLLDRLGDASPYFYTYRRILLWASR